MDEQRIIDALKPFIPAPALPILAKWMVEERVGLTIARPRATKIGDYRPPFGNKGHRISVNANLNRYAFLVTLVHEFAHLHTWKVHQMSVAPHGMEWKMHFQQLMEPFLQMDIFPPHIHHALSAYMLDPAAATCRDDRLLRALNMEDEQQEGWKKLEELPQGAVFVLESGRAFVKGERLRKYFRCQEVDTGRWFRVNELASAFMMK